MAEAKRGRDVSRYKEAWDCIRRAAPDEPEAQRDDAWIDAVEARNRAETARLEAQLRGYKNNLIKESIRVRAPRPASRGARLADAPNADGQRGPRRAL